jgi:hypothetical protein
MDSTQSIIMPFSGLGLRVAGGSGIRTILGSISANRGFDSKAAGRLRVETSLGRHRGGEEDGRE